MLFRRLYPKPRPQQLELPLRQPEPTDDEIRRLWRAALARLRARKEMELLQNSRVEHETLPN